MFESRLRFIPTRFAMEGGALDAAYASCWAGLKDKFKP
jgi:homogentisate 1,2-dioxygenase